MGIVGKWLTAILCTLVLLAPAALGAPSEVDPRLVDLLRLLISRSSQNGVDPEEGVVHALVDYAKGIGCSYEVISSGVARRPIFLAHAGPRDVSGLLLVGHTDTVKAGRLDSWDQNPLQAKILEGKLFGLGACDNKGGVVTGLAALQLAMADKGLTRGLTLACVPDEEAGATGELGIKVLRQLGKLKALGAIYTYPGQDKIILGHRGVWRFKVIAKSRSQHTGSLAWQNSSRDANAVTGMADFALELEALAPSLEGRGQGLFSDYATVVTPAETAGGIAYNQVPDFATLKVDVRLVPETDLQTMKTLIYDALRKVGKRRPSLHFELVEEFYIPPTQIGTDSLIARSLSEAVKKFGNNSPPFGVSGPANESYLLNQAEIPTAVFGPLGGNAHSPNEFIVLESIPGAARIYIETLRNFGPP